MSYYLNIAFAIVLATFVAYVLNLVRIRSALNKEMEMLEKLK